MPIKSITSLDGNKSGNATPQRGQSREQGRSFADVYASLGKASNNDNAPTTAQPVLDPKAIANQKYIQNLHESVNTLRGEILARVILTAHNPNTDATTVTDDISRLSVRLDKLKSKLNTAESALSGKLIDINI